MKISLRTADHICLAAVLLVSALGIALALARGAERRRQIQRQEELCQKRLGDLNVAMKNLRRVQFVLRRTQQQLSDLDKRIPESGSIGGLLEQLDRLMKQRRVVLLNLEPQLAAKERTYTRTPVRIVFTGPFSSIHRFMYDLESMDRVMRMERMSITRLPMSANCRAEVTTSFFER